MAASEAPSGQHPSTLSDYCRASQGTLNPTPELAALGPSTHALDRARLVPPQCWYQERNSHYRNHFSALAYGSSSKSNHIGSSHLPACVGISCLQIIHSHRTLHSVSSPRPASVLEAPNPVWLNSMGANNEPVHTRSYIALIPFAFPNRAPRFLVINPRSPSIVSFSSPSLLPPTHPLAPACILWSSSSRSPRPADSCGGVHCRCKAAGPETFRFQFGNRCALQGLQLSGVGIKASGSTRPHS